MRVCSIPLLFTSLIWPARAQARPAPIASFDDAPGDATGPGTYRKPLDSELSDGDFDIRRFTVSIDGKDVVFEVTLGSLFREPAVTARGTITPVPLWNHIYLQNIDIYIDTDPMSESGSSECIPGRRVAFTQGRTWKAAVVLTPQPGPTANIVRDAFGETARRVVIPNDLTTRGRTVTARVSAAALGGYPSRAWAYSVHISGARWDRSFDVAGRILRGKPQPNAFTMDVRPIAEGLVFGGAPNGDAHPRVVDVLLPKGADQGAVLGSFDPETGIWARVPFVSLTEPPPTSVTAPSGAYPVPPTPLVVADVVGKTVTVSGPIDRIIPMRIGVVQDASGKAIAKIVVVSLLPGGFVAEVLEGRDRVIRGARVRFDH